MNIAVIGAGAWGTALAIQLAKKHSVSLWGRDGVSLDAIAKNRVNEKYLPGVTLASNILITSQFDLALANADMVLIVTSTAGLAASVERIHKIAPSTPIIWACKGFDRATGKLPHETEIGRAHV